MAPRSDVIMAAVEPLPLVPVRCTDGYVRSGFPMRWTSSRIRSSVGSERRLGILDSKSMWPSSQAAASAKEEKGICVTTHPLEAELTDRKSVVWEKCRD